MRLSTDPETGLPFERTADISGWRIVMLQPIGRPGRPRVVKGPDGDPLDVPASATEEEVAQFLADNEVPIEGLRIVAKALDSKGTPIFDREIDLQLDDGGNGDEQGLQAQSVSDESLQVALRALVDSQRVLAGVVDRLTETVERQALGAMGRAEEAEQQEGGVSVIDKLATLLGAAPQANALEKNGAARDVTPTAAAVTAPALGSGEGTKPGG